MSNYSLMRVQEGLSSTSQAVDVIEGVRRLRKHGGFTDLRIIFSSQLEVPRDNLGNIGA